MCAEFKTLNFLLKYTLKTSIIEYIVANNLHKGRSPTDDLYSWTLPSNDLISQNCNWLNEVNWNLFLENVSNTFSFKWSYKTRSCHIAIFQYMLYLWMCVGRIDFTKTFSCFRDNYLNRDVIFYWNYFWNTEMRERL